MIYKVLAFIIITGISGVKKPFYGGFAGLVAAPLLSMVFRPFDLPTFLVVLLFGFGLGLLCGRISCWIFHGIDDKQQKTKTHVMPITSAGGGQRGCIIYTDEEEKNAKENKKPIE